jgi:uncharacterized phage-associated protein
MKTIRFRYDRDKVMNALAFFSRNGVAGLDQMKSSKLLFLADRAHLLRYGRTITGDRYVCMEHGPVPSMTRDLVNARFADDPDDTSMNEYFDVERSSAHPQLVAKHEPDLDVFSDSDIEVLTEVVATYGKKTAWQLRELAHEFPEIEAALAARRAAKQNVVPIPFESFFDASSPMIELVRQDQDDRDFAESLTW